MAKHLIKLMQSQDIFEMGFKPMDVDSIRSFITSEVFSEDEVDDKDKLKIQLLTERNVKITKEDTLDHQWNADNLSWHIWESPRDLEKQNHDGLYEKEFKTPHFICVDIKDETLYVIHLASCWFYMELERHQNYPFTYNVDPEIRLSKVERLLRNEGEYRFIGCEGYDAHFDRLKEKCNMYVNLVQRAFGNGYVVKAAPIMCIYDVGNNSIRGFEYVDEHTGEDTLCVAPTRN